MKKELNRIMKNDKKESTEFNSMYELYAWLSIEGNKVVSTVVKSVYILDDLLENDNRIEFTTLRKLIKKPQQKINVNEKCIYNLELHEELRVANDNILITRVSGGWLYTIYRLDEKQMNTSFVPFNNEFMEK